jgi:hypothetical protein
VICGSLIDAVAFGKRADRIRTSSMTTPKPPDCSSKLLAKTRGVSRSSSGRTYR